MGYYNNLSLSYDAPTIIDRSAPVGSVNPWITVYLEKQGLRTAAVYETGWYVLVPTAGGVIKVWATDLD